MNPPVDTSLVALLTLLSVVISIALYVWGALAFAAMFRKMGEDAWKGWVPVLNLAVILKWGGFSPWLVLLSFLPIANVVVFVLIVISAHRLNSGFGYGTGMTVVAALALVIWASILGFGPARWLGARPAGVAAGTPRRSSSRGPDAAGHAPSAAPQAGRPQGVAPQSAAPQARVISPDGSAPVYGAPQAPPSGSAAWGGAAVPPVPPLPAAAPAAAAPAYAPFAPPPASSAGWTPPETSPRTAAPGAPPTTPAPTGSPATGAAAPDAATTSAAPTSAAPTSAAPTSAAPTSAAPTGAAPASAAASASAAPAPAAASASAAPTSPAPTIPAPPSRAAAPGAAPAAPAPYAPTGAAGAASSSAPSAAPTGAAPTGVAPTGIAPTSPPAGAAAMSPPTGAAPASPPAGAAPASDDAAEGSFVDGDWPSEVDDVSAIHPSPFPPSSAGGRPFVAPPVGRDPGPIAFVPGIRAGNDAPPPPAPVTRVPASRTIDRGGADDVSGRVVAPFPGDPGAPAEDDASPPAPLRSRRAQVEDDADGFPELSGEVSAVAGSPTAGSPRSAAGAVSAQHRLADEDDLTTRVGARDDVDDDIDETVLARRAVRATWELVPAAGSPVPLTASVVILGRRPAGDAAFPTAQLVAVRDDARTVSKTHARIEQRGDAWIVTDLGSTNGVLVRTLMGDEVEVEPGGQLDAGERFFLGDEEFHLRRITH